MNLTSRRTRENMYITWDTLIQALAQILVASKSGTKLYFTSVGTR